jgi:hypothetical protein
MVLYHSHKFCTVQVLRCVALVPSRMKNDHHRQTLGGGGGGGDEGG